MDTNSPVELQFFTDCKRCTPIYLRLYLLSALFSIIGFAVTFGYTNYVSLVVWAGIETSGAEAEAVAKMVAKAARGVELLQNIKLAAIGGGIIWCIGWICYPKRYLPFLGLNWIKKNNIDYKKYFKPEDVNASKESRKYTRPEMGMLSAAYFHAFPQEKSKEYIKVAITVVMGLVGIIIVAIGTVTHFASQLEGFTRYMETVKVAFKNNYNGKIPIESSNVGVLIMIVGFAILSLAECIDAMIVIDKRKKRAWHDEIAREKAQNQNDAAPSASKNEGMNNEGMKE